MPWLLETIRATAFAPDIKALGLSDWQTLTGTQPHQTQYANEADSTVEAGPFMRNWLTLGLARRPPLGLGRADLILAISRPAEPFAVVPAGPMQERIEPVAIGPFATSFLPFIELAKRWFSTDTVIRRLAVAGTLWERTSNADEALDIILRNVRSFKKKGNNRIIDFLIRLNRPRTSSVNPAISINRFAQWSARTVDIVLPTRNIMFRPPMFRYERAQADLDISTADGVEIPGRQIPAHIDELAKLLMEIAEKGDIP
jgi:hypothetical protein